MGGNADSFECAKGVFDVLGGSAVLCGEAGAGNFTKLANQIIVGANIHALAEALVLTQKAGLDPETVFNAIKGGLAGSNVMNAKAPMMFGRNFDPGFRIELHLKDVNNAMQTAVASTDSEWICMTDADCVQTSRRTLSVAMRYALDNGADLLSVLPNLEMRGFWENVVQPICGGIMMIWFRPDKVNSPTKPNAYANGAFMLMRRSAYQAVGTHEAVKDEVNEDMHLARQAKRLGLRLRVLRGGGMYRVRMYTGLGQIWRGWSRIFYGCFGTFPRLLVSVVMLSIFSLSPYLSLLASPLAGSANSGSASMLPWPVQPCSMLLY